MAPDTPEQPQRAESFEEYLATRETTLLHTAVFLTGDRHAGEDLLQDVLLAVFRRWRSIDDPDSYVRRALVNRVVSRRRIRRVREEELHDAVEVNPAYRPSPRWDAELTGVRDELLAALRALPPKQRAVLVLRYFADLTEEQTAAALGCARGTVKTHASRGLARMRHELAPPQESIEGSWR